MSEKINNNYLEKYLKVLFILGIIVSMMFATVVPGFDSQKGLNRILSFGKMGSDVRWVQHKLNEQGFQVGAVDGIYGFTTLNRVKEFQKKNNLAVTGTVDEKTFARLNGTGEDNGRKQHVGRNSFGVKLSEKDLLLLARAVNGEARGEPFEGQVAVAAVILNRVESPQFPKSVPGVIFQRGAFDAVEDGQIWLQPSREAIRAAYVAAQGKDNTGGALYYFNPAKSTSRWIWTRPQIKQIGNHIFAK
ncbi:spore cortex-lytic enzyme [Thermincola ferriacetica]|uniref:spore cortex-lytic enzyme n=1 Tax=Thermincola ferriacetica TaxID=281456 RepID=UPI00191014D9|nr:spore cortex-lytic enzyme [Thermincola ferriacetica]